MHDVLVALVPKLQLGNQRKMDLSFSRSGALIVIRKYLRAVVIPTGPYLALGEKQAGKQTSRFLKPGRSNWQRSELAGRFERSNMPHPAWFESYPLSAALRTGMALNNSFRDHDFLGTVVYNDERYGMGMMDFEYFRAFRVFCGQKSNIGCVSDSRSIP